MGNRTTLLVLLFVLCHGVAVTMGLWRNEGEERKEGPPRPDKMFMMMNSKRVVKTDAGEMRVLESYGGKIMERRLHIGFITMQPRSLFIPQYIDSSFIMFVREGIKNSLPLSGSLLSLVTFLTVCMVNHTCPQKDIHVVICMKLESKVYHVGKLCVD